MMDFLIGALFVVIALNFVIAFLVMAASFVGLGLALAAKINERNDWYKTSSDHWESCKELFVIGLVFTAFGFVARGVMFILNFIN